MPRVISSFLVLSRIESRANAVPRAYSRRIEARRESISRQFPATRGEAFRFVAAVRSIFTQIANTDTHGNCRNCRLRPFEKVRRFIIILLRLAANRERITRGDTRRVRKKILPRIANARNMYTRYTRRSSLIAFPCIYIYI